MRLRTLYTKKFAVSLHKINIPKRDRARSIFARTISVSPAAECRVAGRKPGTVRLSRLARAPDIVSACRGERGPSQEEESTGMRVRAVNVRGEVAGRRNSSNPAAAAAVNTGAATAPRATEICESNFDAVTFRNAADRSVGLLSR